MESLFDEALLKKNLANFIKNYMEIHHLSYGEFGNLVNLSENTIKNFCKENVVPSVEAIYNLSIYLHVNMVQILELPQQSNKIEKKVLLKKISQIKDDLSELEDYIKMNY